MEERSVNAKVILGIDRTTALGLLFTLIVVITGVVSYFASPRLFGSGITQFSLVVGLIVGPVLITFGLHSSGKIGKDTFDRTTLVLAVAAIVFATWQFRDSRVQESTMELLSRQMSTRFVGMFPKNMGDNTV